VNNHLLILLSILFLTACATTQSELNVTIPKESITSQAPALANDVLNNINIYVQQKFECEDWRIVNVQHVSADTQITFTKEGQIYAGKVTETWSINQCGLELDLGLVMMPDGNGGSYIAIAKL
jgi:biopolymer transport protein ExbD